MDTLTRNVNRQRAFVASCHAEALRLKQSGALGGLMAPESYGGLDEWRQQARYKERYSLLHGWVFAAVDALARKAASQAVNVGRLTAMPTRAAERSRLATRKAYYRSRMTAAAGRKAESPRHQLEVMEDHPLLLSLEHPNAAQHRWQFVYSFVVNLAMTGWAFVVRDKTKDGRHEFYQLPTTWVTPEHSKGLFAEFTVHNPKKPGVKKETLKREFVGFAHLPNPSDPLSALAPAGAQMSAVRIDDHIQASQERFFDNGIFPSVAIVVGKDPLGIGSQSPPRLSAAQRRQVNLAISKESAGWHNYGRPVILDGLIEKVERFSMTQTEMGWDKSEDRVIDRILSAFGVHRFILGYALQLGSHAQASQIRMQFAERVNGYLDLLGNLMTSMAGTAEQDESLLVWWDKCDPQDPQLRNRLLATAVKDGVLDADEMRGELGYPPREYEAEPEQSGEEEALEEATEALERAVKILGVPASAIAGRIEEAVRV